VLCEAQVEVAAIRERRKEQKGKENKKKWSKITYTRNRLTIVTKLIKNTSINISFKINNTTAKLTQPKTTNNKHVISGKYQLKCHECSKKCTQQTGRIVLDEI
jgi:hypothetical protein